MSTVFFNLDIYEVKYKVLLFVCVIQIVCEDRSFEVEIMENCIYTAYSYMDTI